MMVKLLLLLTIVPAVELYLLLQIGSWLGPLQTVALILITGMVGAYIAKREGFGLLTTLRDELAKGMPPGERLMEGALVIAGGLLLVTPGVFTDLAGFALILPPTRRWVAPRALAWLLTKVTITSGRPTQPTDKKTPFSTPFDDLP